MKKYTPLNAAHSPEVLVFQITAITPPVYFHCDGVFTASDIPGNIELRRYFAILAIANQLFIYPDIKCRAYRSKMKEHLFAASIQKEF